MVTHRNIERSRGLPLAARLLLVVAIAALAGTVLLTSRGMLGDAVGGLGSAVGGVVDRFTPATPSPTLPPVADSPALVPPTESYTNQPTVDITATVPASIVGASGYRLRVYQLVKGGPPTLRAETPVGVTPTVLVQGVSLSSGANDFQATVVGPGGESEPSAVITYVLDKSAPKVTLTAPKDGAVVNASSAAITGKTQGRSSIVARNETNGQSATAAAATDGTFTLNIQLAPGPNKITVTATDPATNTGSTSITIRRGSGQVTATLRSSVYRLTAAKLPQPLTLTAVVTDPDGNPLANAPVTFTLSIPGIPVVTQEALTDDKGTATFTTTVPAGATPGNGLATVLLTASNGSSTSARTAIVIQ